jgi:hypothetical protein
MTGLKRRPDKARKGEAVANAEILGRVRLGREKATADSAPRPILQHSAEEAAKKLAAVDPDLARSLAALNGAPEAIAAATITAYRFGTRTVLNSMGLLEDGEDKSGRLRISERGLQVIAACAESFPQVDTDVEGALRNADRVSLGSGGVTRVKLK